MKRSKWVGKLIDSKKIQVVIADIHCHFDELQREFKYDPQEHHLIYLGDYIDRGPNSGPNSCEVVNEVMREVLEEDAIALLGNHELIILNALTSELSKNRINDMLLWLINGGQKTINSYKKNGKRAMQRQHFSLYHSQAIDFTGIFTDFKSVSNSEFFKAFV